MPTGITTLFKSLIRSIRWLRSLATNRITASLANSDGWMPMLPTPSQRTAPLTLCPAPSIFITASSSSAASTPPTAVLITVGCCQAR